MIDRVATAPGGGLSREPPNEALGPEHLARRLVELKPRRVLEIAAGTGVVTRALAETLTADINIVATDLNPAMLEQAQSIGTSRPVEWRQADAMALPHLVHDGENGYLFDPTSRDDLAAKLTTVLTADPAERLRLQESSLEGVKVHDIDRTLRTFEALYRGLPVEG